MLPIIEKYEFVSDLPDYIQSKIKTIIMNSNYDNKEDVYANIISSKIKDVYGMNADKTSDNLDKVLKPYTEEYQIADLMRYLPGEMSSKDLDTAVKSFFEYGKFLGVNDYSEIIFAPWEELDMCGEPWDMPGYTVLRKLKTGIKSGLVTHDLVPFNFIIDKWGYYFRSSNDIYTYIENCMDYLDLNED